MSLANVLLNIKQFGRVQEVGLFKLVFTSRSIISSSNSSTTDQSQSQLGEKQIRMKINITFPNSSNVIVEDISGGCGAMYQIHIEDNKFIGLSKVKQHQLVNEALKDEIKAMHGIRISTRVPSTTTSTS